MNKMTVEELKGILNPQIDSYDLMDAETFLKDTSISWTKKAEILYGKAWVNVPDIQNEINEYEKHGLAPIAAWLEYPKNVVQSK